MSKLGAILLVDDDETVLEFGSLALAPLGREVMVADNGRRCLDIIASEGERIELIVLDMRMPEMNGDEALRQLRAKGCTTPVLLCSGFDLGSADLAESGATAYLAKPYRINQLKESCRQLLHDQS